MKKFGLQLIIILLLGSVAQCFFPFWSIAVVAVLAGFFFRYENSAVSFVAGMAAGALLWGGYAFFLDDANLGQLSGQIGQLFKVGPAYIHVVTTLIGGLLGALGAQTGTLARRLFEKEPNLESE